jgi:hypothetical protein
MFQVFVYFLCSGLEKICTYSMPRVSRFENVGATVLARYLDLHKINNSSCNYLGSFFIENLSLKKHLINMKTALLMTDSSKCDGFC